MLPLLTSTSSLLGSRFGIWSDAQVQMVMKADGQLSWGLGLCRTFLSQQEQSKSGHPHKGCNWDQTLGLMHLLDALGQVLL